MECCGARAEGVAKPAVAAFSSAPMFKSGIVVTEYNKRPRLRFTLLLGCTTSAIAEAVAFSEKAGLDRHRLLEVLSHGHGIASCTGGSSAGPALRHYGFWGRGSYPR